MRFVPYILILIGLICLAHAGYDEYRGIASVSTRTASHVVYRDKHPERFRDQMIYEWGRGVIFLLAGFVMRGIHRRQDSLDPLSHEFTGTKEVDELDRILIEEQKKRNRPIR